MISGIPQGSVLEQTLCLIYINDLPDKLTSKVCLFADDTAVITRQLEAWMAVSIRFHIVLRFYGPVNPMGSCRARSVYLTIRLLGRLSPLSG